MIFQAAVYNFQPQVWHGGGLARAAHWIFMRSYIKYYADSNSIAARESSQPIKI
jgi:hypothetical protein